MYLLKFPRVVRIHVYQDFLIAVVLDFVKPNRVRSSNFFISISTKWPGVGLSCFPLTCFLIDQEQSVELFSYAPSNFRGYVIYGV